MELTDIYRNLVTDAYHNQDKNNAEASHKLNAVILSLRSKSTIEEFVSIYYNTIYTLREQANDRASHALWIPTDKNIVLSGRKVLVLNAVLSISYGYEGSRIIGYKTEENSECTLFLSEGPLFLI